MKKLLLSAFTVTIAVFSVNAQCTTTNATSCVCEDGTNNCYLLPDITASWQGISNNGFTEYPQTGAGTNYANQGPDDGRIRVSASTPNIGHGSFTVRGYDSEGKRAFICGPDTIFGVAPTGAFTCPNGEPNPKQLIIQRVYRKDGNTMSHTDYWSGSMTYHPAHGHMHVDNWAVMTLRIQTTDPNPLNWPIVGDGAKIGFCLMDYGQCGTSGASTYYGHCRDENRYYQQGNILLNSNFPNWNLGGGNYNCAVSEQGISSGWTDVYGKHLEGMWINVPKSTCNGDYWIVLEVDKDNYFMEEDEDNNWTAVPVTLTMQNPVGTAFTPLIWSEGSRTICGDGSVTLTATGGSSFLWSNGATTQTIQVTEAGFYTCEVTNYCGTATSEPYYVNAVDVNSPEVVGDTVCVEGIMTLSATGSGMLKWYDTQGNLINVGETYETPVLTETTTYFVRNVDSFLDTMNIEPQDNGFGGGSYISSQQYLLFDADVDLKLLSANVYAQNAGTFTVDLVDGSGITVVETQTFTVPAGMSRINFNWDVVEGFNYRLLARNISTGTGLYRNNNLASYPYTIDNVMRITGNSAANTSYYYFFYDMEVSTSAGSCPSELVPVEAVVNECLGLGENVIFKNSVRVAPNPNNGEFKVLFNAVNQADVQIQLVNIVGAEVYSQKIEQAFGEMSFEINANKLSNGVYLLNLIYEGKPYTQKIIVE
jgi:hypothetical protein